MTSMKTFVPPPVADLDVGPGMWRTTAADKVLGGADILPRSVMPAAVTTTIAYSFNLDAWIRGVSIHMVWVNDGASVVDTLWAYNLVQYPIGGLVASGTTLATGLPTITPPGAGAEGLTVLTPLTVFPPVQPIGYMLGFNLARLGGSDANPGAMGLARVGLSWAL